MWSQVNEALNQSLTSVLTGIARMLPGVIALLLSLTVAALLGWLLAVIVRRALTGLEFDRRMSSWGGADVAGWTGGRSPTLLAARVVSWAVLFIGLLVGTAAFDPTLTSQLTLRLFGSMMNLVIAVVLMIVGTVLARFLSQSVLITLVNMNVQQARLLSLGVKWLVLILSAAMALDHLSIGGRIVELAFGILFGGIVLALALAVGLRSKDITEWSLAQSEEGRKQRNQPFDHL
jgi:hypothetical protein